MLNITKAQGLAKRIMPDMPELLALVGALADGQLPSDNNDVFEAFVMLEELLPRVQALHTMFKDEADRIGEDDPMSLIEMEER